MQRSDDVKVARMRQDVQARLLHQGDGLQHRNSIQYEALACDEGLGDPLGSCAGYLALHHLSKHPDQDIALIS